MRKHEEDGGSGTLLEAQAPRAINSPRVFILSQFDLRRAADQTALTKVLVPKRSPVVCLQAKMAEWLPLEPIKSKIFANDFRWGAI